MRAARSLFLLLSTVYCLLSTSINVEVVLQHHVLRDGAAVLLGGAEFDLLGGGDGLLGEARRQPLDDADVRHLAAGGEDGAEPDGAGHVLLARLLGEAGLGLEGDGRADGDLAGVEGARVLDGAAAPASARPAAAVVAGPAPHGG